MKDSKPRYATIDALRGLAALGVFLSHLMTNEMFGEAIRETIPGFILRLCHHGNFGVQVFFVISGFVIALSLSQRPLTRSGAFNFMLRRELRLNPPYAVALLGAAALKASFGQPFPDLGTIAINLFYLQGILGVPEILGVAWTLCIEVQFYLAFLLLLALDRWLGKPGEAPISQVGVTLMWVTAVISCLLVQIGTPWQIATYAPYTWFYFAIGALCFWCWRGWAPVWTLGVVMLGLTCSALWGILTPGDSYVSASFEGIETGLITALSIFYLAGRGKLETLSLGKIGQFLGRISYSLYLTHAISANSGFWLAQKIWGLTNTGALMGIALGLVWAFILAEIFHRAIERPSMIVASKFKMA
jgi:peptidoglycan/LPS O-acetylase OafA/YrhL